MRLFTRVVYISIFNVLQLASVLLGKNLRVLQDKCVGIITLKCQLEASLFSAYFVLKTLLIWKMLSYIFVHFGTQEYAWICHFYGFLYHL